MWFASYRWMRYEDFVSDVRARGGFEDAEEAERAIAVVARVLGERLLPQERAGLAAALPEPVARRILEARYERDFDATEFYDRVARGTAIRHGFGVEHTQAVCQVIGERLPGISAIASRRSSRPRSTASSPPASAAPCRRARSTPGATSSPAPAPPSRPVARAAVRV
jgi:uncharacterized protein (DUF2267 family)